MERSSSKTSFYLASALSLLMCSPAYAQEPASRDDSATGDIIVTARRTEERLQDVPISITVFNQQQLSNRNVVTATDLATYTPSLSVNQRFGPEKAAFSIRGFVQENATAPSVGVYFADVVAPRAQGGTQSGNNAAVGSFMDLQNVQVLKGPQGTLFGRNTTGGAVILVPQKPTSRLEGYVEGSLGDYNLRRLQGVINIPLAETFKVRIAAERNMVDGYMINHSGIGPRDYNDVNYFAARVSVVADLTPNLENYTIATYSHSFSKGYGARIVGCDDANFERDANGVPQVTNPSALTRPLLGTSACDQLDRQNARGDGPLDVDINNRDSKINILQWQLINTTTWQVSDNLRIKNIVSYAEFREHDAFSLYGDNFTISNPAPVLNGVVQAATRLPASPWVAGAQYAYIQPHPQPNAYNVAQSTFTEELQFQGSFGDGRLNWQAGGYLEISNPLGISLGYSANLLNCSDAVNLICTNPLRIGSVSDSARLLRFNNKGLYAQATFKLTDQLSVTGGIRNTWDKLTSTSSDTRLRPAVAGTTNGPGDFTRTCNDTVTPGIPRTAVANRSACTATLIAKSQKPTWLIGLDYKPTDDILLYAKYARGYRAGGVNPTNVGLETWGPEKVDTYEVGAKASFRGAVPGYFNVAGFYNDFSNQQLNVSGISNVAGFAGSQPVVNAGKSRIQGIEVDASATFFDSLRLDLGYTHLDTKLLEITVPAIPAGAPYSELIPSAAVGDPLALTPKNRATVTGTYTLPLPESVGRVTLGATFIHTDSQVLTRGTAAQFQIQPATDILNLNVNWYNVMEKPVDLAFFMTNVTNQIYHVSVGNAWNSAGFETFNYAAPRMWGVRLKYRFGE